MSITRGLGNMASYAAAGSTFGPIGTAVGAGVGLLTGLVGGLFSDESEQTKAVRDLMQRLKQIQGYTRAEIERSASSFDRAGTTAIASAANNYAIGARGKQNFTSAAVARMLPQVSMLGAQRRAQMEDYNEQLEFKKIQGEASLVGGLDSDSPQDDFLTTMGLAIQGAQIGMTAGSMIPSGEGGAVSDDMLNANYEMPKLLGINEPFGAMSKSITNDAIANSMNQPMNDIILDDIPILSRMRNTHPTGSNVSTRRLIPPVLNQWQTGAKYGDNFRKALRLSYLDF